MGQSFMRRVSLSVHHRHQPDFASNVTHMRRVSGGMGIGLGSGISGLVRRQAAVMGGQPLIEGDCAQLDKFKISQVVRNLVSNALKFSPKNGSIVMKVVFIPAPDGVTVEPTRLTFKAQPQPLPRTPSKANLTAMSSRLYNTLKNSGKGVLTLNSMSMHDSEEGMGMAPIPEDSDIEARRESTIGVVDTTVQRGTLRFSVIDSGAGISAENQKRLFKEIVQFEPEKLQKG
jgi:signal transduction histidine kinase